MAVVALAAVAVVASVAVVVVAVVGTIGRTTTGVVEMRAAAVETAGTGATGEAPMHLQRAASNLPRRMSHPGAILLLVEAAQAHHAPGATRDVAVALEAAAPATASGSVAAVERKAAVVVIVIVGVVGGVPLHPHPAATSNLPRKLAIQGP